MKISAILKSFLTVNDLFMLCITTASVNTFSSSDYIFNVIISSN